MHDNSTKMLHYCTICSTIKMVTVMMAVSRRKLNTENIYTSAASMQHKCVSFIQSAFHLMYCSFWQ